MYKILHEQYKNEELARIELTDEPWCDIIYHYNTVSLDGTNEGVLKFDYDIDSGTIPDGRLIEFETVIGDILQKIIKENSPG
jgi:hypothetical protein